MNNPIKLLISGADMGGLIASCALRHDFHESSWHTDGFQIYRIEKEAHPINQGENSLILYKICTFAP